MSHACQGEPITAEIVFLAASIVTVMSLSHRHLSIFISLTFSRFFGIIASV